MHDIEIQEALNEFENCLLNGSDMNEARTALRALLSQFAKEPVEGSLGDIMSRLASLPNPPAGAAAVVLRAIADEGLIADNARNDLVRTTVSLIEKGLPGLCEFLKVGQKKQAFEKFEVLCGARAWVEGKLGPLNVQYTTLETFLAAKQEIVSSLAHGRLAEFGRVYHLGEVKDSVEAVFLSISRVAKTTATLAADVESCNMVISEARNLISMYPSFITVKYFGCWLGSASKCLEDFTESLRGRFTAAINQDWADLDLPKRYPLTEVGRDLRILVPFSSTGRGAATDVRVTVSSDSQQIWFVNEEISLGSISPGKFSVALDVHVIDPCGSVSAILELEWGEVGTSRRQSALFEVNVLAQASGIDWEAYTYADPYGTAPAKGEAFVGRQEQIQTLTARMLRMPMEPSYITGQKRVGKTSLATAAVEFAQAHDPRDKLSWCYILWGQIAHEDPRVSLKQLGEQIEDFIVGELPGNASLPRGAYEGSLSSLIKLCASAEVSDPNRRFVVIIDEFDEMPQDLYLQGNLADTVFGNIRALNATSNFCLLLVGGENMPFVMDRQGQKLNKFSRVNLTYFDRAKEWDDYVRLVREPSAGFLEWHLDAVNEIYDLTNGNPYFSKIICSKVFARALRERDVDITREEVRDAVSGEISRFDDNLFAHLWQDGIFVPVDEREPIILKRKKVLAALARCVRANLPATVANLLAKRNAPDLTEVELEAVLADFVNREVLVEKDGAYRAVLPIFQLWLADVGLTRLASDALSQNLADEAQRADDAARVLSEELVALTRGWPTYRGKPVGSEEVRAWLNQRPGNRDQRALFTILKSTRFLSEADVLERIRTARLVVLGLADAAVRRKATERRSDIVITYVDGEGKSGQKYASLYAEENLVATTAILPPSSFQSAYDEHVKQHGVPKVIVIIDDIVGTGKSLSENIEKFYYQNVDRLKSDNPLVILFSLLSTKDGEQTIRNTLSKLDYSKIDFRAGEILDDNAAIFSGEKGVFATVEERDRAQALALEIGATIYKNAPLGFGDQGLNIVFPTTVPNNCLPLLHSRGKGATPQWRPLFERLVN